jgi:HK97 family phage prohead protease
LRGLLRDPVPALLHHDDGAPFGHVKVTGRDSRGLLAELHAARTRAGDEALELAAAGVLYPSIGFTDTRSRTDRAGVVWREAITLWEISLVTFQAYPAADVLTVRSNSIQPRNKPRLAEATTILRDARRKREAL